MLLLHDDSHDDMSNRTEMEAGRVVILPFLGLQVLPKISYVELAAKVRRGDGKLLDEGLMKAVWRGVVFNLFYFEEEGFKLNKLAEEDWTSVLQLQQQLGAAAGVGGSSSRKRKFEEI